MSDSNNQPKITLDGSEDHCEDVLSLFRGATISSCRPLLNSSHPEVYCTPWNLNLGTQEHLELMRSLNRHIHNDLEAPNDTNLPCNPFDLFQAFENLSREGNLTHAEVLKGSSLLGIEPQDYRRLRSLKLEELRRARAIADRSHSNSGRSRSPSCESEEEGSSNDQNPQSNSEEAEASFSPDRERGFKRESMQELEGGMNYASQGLVSDKRYPFPQVNQAALLGNPLPLACGLMSPGAPMGSGEALAGAVGLPSTIPEIPLRGLGAEGILSATFPTMGPTEQYGIYQYKAHNFIRRSRGEKKPIPEERKDQQYYERRGRNNIAAKKSRDARKLKEKAIAEKTEMLEGQNAILRASLAMMVYEASYLRYEIRKKLEESRASAEANSNFNFPQN